MSQTRPSTRIPVPLIVFLFSHHFIKSGAKTRFTERNHTNISRFGARDPGRRRPKFLQEDTSENKVIQDIPHVSMGR